MAGDQPMQLTAMDSGKDSRASLFCHIIILPCQRLSVYVWTDYLAWNWKGRQSAWDMTFWANAHASAVARFELHLNKARDAPLQERLASAVSTITIDWPGFGDQPRPARCSLDPDTRFAGRGLW